MQFQIRSGTVEFYYYLAVELNYINNNLQLIIIYLYNPVNQQN